MYSLESRDNSPRVPVCPNPLRMPCIEAQPVLQHRAENWGNDIPNQLHQRGGPTLVVAQHTTHHLGTRHPSHDGLVLSAHGKL